MVPLCLQQIELCESLQSSSGGACPLAAAGACPWLLANNAEGRGSFPASPAFVGDRTPPPECGWPGFAMSPCRRRRGVSVAGAC